MKTIERLRELEKAATPAPWKPHYRDSMWKPDMDQDGLIEAGPGDWGGFKIADHNTINRLTSKHCKPDDDIALIAATRNALPALIAVVEAQAAEIAAWREGHDADNEDGGTALVYDLTIDPDYAIDFGKRLTAACDKTDAALRALEGGAG